jgi:hypothetical protein
VRGRGSARHLRAVHTDRNFALPVSFGRRARVPWLFGLVYLPPPFHVPYSTHGEGSTASVHCGGVSSTPAVL